MCLATTVTGWECFDVRLGDRFSISAILNVACDFGTLAGTCVGTRDSGLRVKMAVVVGVGEKPIGNGQLPEGRGKRPGQFVASGQV